AGGAMGFVGGAGIALNGLSQLGAQDRYNRNAAAVADRLSGYYVDRDGKPHNYRDRNGTEHMEEAEFRAFSQPFRVDDDSSSNLSASGASLSTSAPTGAVAAATSGPTAAPSGSTSNHYNGSRRRDSGLRTVYGPLADADGGHVAPPNAASDAS